MIEFGKREAGAAAAVLATAVVGGIGWWTIQQRHQATAADIAPTFPDGTPAQTAGPDGTLELPAQGPVETVPASSDPASDEASKPTPANASGLIVVFVSGAVKRPGVYTFKPGSRLYHALRAAGGLKANAQPDALNLADELRDADQIYFPPRSKSSGSSASRQTISRPLIVSGTVPKPGLEPFNSRRPQRVSVSPPEVTVRPLVISGATDSAASQNPSGNLPEAMVAEEAPRTPGRVLGKPSDDAAAVTKQADFAAPSATAFAGAAENQTVSAAVPDAGAATATGKSAGRSRSTGAKFKNPGDGVVNINTAGLEELQKLPGIGPSMAQRVVDYRTQIGRFGSPEQVQDIKGIGEKKYAKLRPFIVVR